MRIAILTIALLLAASVSAKICFSISSDSFCVYASDLGTTVKFRYDAPSTVGWVAFGPGQSMKYGDIVVAWPNKDNTVTLSRRLVNAELLPTFSDTLNRVTVVQNETGILTVDGKKRMIATFTREKTQLSGVPSQYAISSSSGSYIWAGHPTLNPGLSSASAVFVEHPKSSAGNLNVKLLDPANSFGANSTGNSTNTITTPAVSPLLIAHGLVFTIAWAFFAPIAIFIARFFKQILGEWWFRIHASFFMLVTALTIAGFALIFVKIASNGGTHFSTRDLKTASHSIIGLLLVILTLIQTLLGIIIDRLFDPNRNKIPVMDKVHWWLGRGIWILAALVLIPIGISLFGDSTDTTFGNILLIAYGVYILLVIVAFIVLQVRVGQVHHQENEKESYPLTYQLNYD